MHKLSSRLLLLKVEISLVLLLLKLYHDVMSVEVNLKPTGSQYKIGPLNPAVAAAEHFGRVSAHCCCLPRNSKIRTCIILISIILEFHDIAL